MYNNRCSSTRVFPFLYSFIFAAAGLCGYMNATQQFSIVKNLLERSRRRKSSNIIYKTKQSSHFHLAAPSVVLVTARRVDSCRRRSSFYTDSAQLLYQLHTQTYKDVVALCIHTMEKCVNHLLLRLFFLFHCVISWCCCCWLAGRVIYLYPVPIDSSIY